MLKDTFAGVYADLAAYHGISPSADEQEKRYRQEVLGSFPLPGIPEGKRVDPGTLLLVDEEEVYYPGYMDYYEYTRQQEQVASLGVTIPTSALLNTRPKLTRNGMPLSALQQTMKPKRKPIFQIPERPYALKVTQQGTAVEVELRVGTENVTLSGEQVEVLKSDLARVLAALSLAEE